MRVRMTDNRALEPGAWTFTLVQDDDEPIETSCTVSADSHAVSCDDGEGGISAEIWGDPSNPYTRFSTSFAAMDGKDTLPQTIDVHIEIDGATVHHHRYAPHYELTEPRCDSDCFSDSIDVVIDQS